MKEIEEESLGDDFSVVLLSCWFGKSLNFRLGLGEKGRRKRAHGDEVVGVGVP